MVSPPPSDPAESFLAAALAHLATGEALAALRAASSACHAATLEAAAERYLAELHALAPDKARIVDKMSGNTMNPASPG